MDKNQLGSFLLPHPHCIMRYICVEPTGNLQLHDLCSWVANMTCVQCTYL